MTNNQAIVDLSGFVSEKMLEQFKKVTVENGTSFQVVLSDFIKDYIVSGGHPEAVVNRQPWNRLK